MLQEGRASTAAHAEARIRPIVAAGASTVLRVVLSAASTASTSATSATDAAAPGPQPASRRLSLTVVPRGLRVALGGRRTRTLRLSPGGDAQATFRLVGVDRGPGEVSVVIRDGDGDPLATLQLTVEVVASDDHDQTGIARVTAAVPARPVPQRAAEPPLGVTPAELGSTA